MTGVDANTNNVERNEPSPAPDPRPAHTGQIVRFGGGPLAGVEGVIVDRCESGQYLVQLSQGVYVETTLAEFDALYSPHASESA